MSTPSGGAHDTRFDRWDAAYVLGALDSADRRAYETHLDVCADCRADVAELSGMPGLLNRITPDAGLALIETEFPGGSVHHSAAPSDQPAALTAPTDLTERLQRRRRNERRHSVRLVLVAAVVAAVVAVGGTLGLRMLLADRPSVTTDLAAARTSPLTANVELYRKKWGTEVDTTCSYANQPTSGTPVPPNGRPYGVYVVDAAGRSSLVSSWSAWPGSTISTRGATSAQLADIRRVELRSLTSGAVLLSHDIPG